MSSVVAEEKRWAIAADRLFTGVEWLQDQALLLRGTQIEARLPIHLLGEEVELQRFPDALLIPGLIDLQVNGAGGVALNPHLTAEAVLQVHQANLQVGGTAYLPTRISASFEQMRAAVASVREAKSLYPQTILGLHLEGPFLNPQKVGIHDPKFLRAPSREELEFLLESADVLSVVTLAPEVFPLRWIRPLVDAGIKVSLGHSNATYEEAMEAFEQGASGVTHLFNAMSPFESRAPGLVGAAFNHPEAFVCAIPDGHHVAWPVLQAAVRAIQGTLCWVTDALASAGSSLEQFEFAGKEIFVRQGKCTDASGRLAGSNLTPFQALRNSRYALGFSSADSIRALSSSPAKFLGVEDRIGYLRAGCTANALLVSPEFELLGVLFQGAWVKQP